MVKLKLKVGPKGQIVLPKSVREGLGIRTRSRVVADFRGDELVLRKEMELEELLLWLKATRKPIAEAVSTLGLENEALAAIS